MKKIYFVICDRKFEKPNLSYTLEKILVLSIYIKWKNENEKGITEEESIEILKIRGLIQNV